MTKQYKQFTKKQFEFLLRKNAIENKLGFMQEIEINSDTWEHVYKLTTRNKAVDILIYSSVDKRTEKTREKGSDCVRLVLRWNTRNGFLYQKISKHYRLESLFENISKSVKEAQKNVFDLDGKKFSKIA